MSLKRVQYETKKDESTSGWIFILKEHVRELTLDDYEPLDEEIIFTDNVKREKGYKRKRMEKILCSMHEGRWISNMSLLELIKTYKLYCHRMTYVKIMYMAEMDIKSDIIRHKNYRTGIRRRYFDGVFNVYENAVEKTLDAYLEIKSRE